MVTVIKVTSSNLSLVESGGPANPLNIPLYDRTVNVNSCSAQGSATDKQANIEVMHRQRMPRGVNVAPGPC